MTTVKFDKSVKYMGVRYAAHEAFKVEDSDVAALHKAGATVLFVDDPAPSQHDEDIEPEGAEQAPEGQEEEAADQAADLLSYTVAELMQFAKERGIDLKGKTKKAEIYNIIVASIH